MKSLSTWLAVIALAANYGARAVVPIVSHVICGKGACDALGLIGAAASAFFSGDLLAQVVAKPLVRQLSGKQLLAGGTAGWSLLLVLVPLVIQRSLALFFAAQFSFGFFCGLGYPASHALLAETVPSSLRSTAVSLIISASAVGTMASNFLIPQVVQRVGWATPFIGLVAIGGCTSLLVITCCPAKPAEAVSELRKSDSESSFQKSGGIQEVGKWMQDPLIQALVLGMYASGVANAFLFSFVATLFVEGFGAEIAELGMLTTAAPLGNSMCCVLSGLLADYLISSRMWLPHQCRQLMQAVGTAVPAVSLLMLCRTESTVSAAILVTLWMSSHGFQTSGLTAMLHDVAHARASELFAIGNVFSKFAGVMAGPLISRIARSWGWHCVLFIICLHYVAAGTLLVALMPRAEATSRLFTHPCYEEAEMSPASDADSPASPLLLKRNKLGLSIKVSEASPRPAEANDAPRPWTAKAVMVGTAERLLQAADHMTDPSSPYLPGGPMSKDRPDLFSPKYATLRKRQIAKAE